MKKNRQKRDRVLLAVAAWMGKQDRLLRKNRRRAMGGQIEPLHDMRVALRRFRMILRTFQEPLRTTSAARLLQDLTHLSKALGPIRDMQLWVVYLESEQPPGKKKADTGWTQFVKDQQRIGRRLTARLGLILSDASWRRLDGRIRRLLNREIPRAARRHAGGDLRVLGAAAIRKALSRIEKRSDISSRNNPHEMHALRIACRQGRYVAELFGDALGRPVTRLARRLKALQDALGDVHDIDVRLEHLARQARPPTALTARLRHERKKSCKHFTEAWARYEKPRFQQTLQRKLRRHLKKPGANG